MLNKISFRGKLNLSQSCSLFVATLVLITGLILSLLSWSNLHKQLHANHLQSVQQQLQRLTIAIAPSLLLQDRISININLQEWTKASELNFIRVLNTNHQAIAEAGQHRAKSAVINHSITQDNLAIGSIRAEINFSKTSNIVSRHLGLGLTITAFFTLFSALVSYLICERYFRYIRRLTLQFKLWQTDKTQPITLPSPPKLPELCDLHNAVVNLSEHNQLQSKRNNAVQQFGLAQPIETKQLQYHSCALLFIEIKNLNELQMSLSAQELTDLLNRYYQLLAQACKLYGGRLERYAGNGVVVLFGLQPNNTQQAAMHALYTAQLFLGIAKHKRQQADAHFVDFRLACHWGDVLLAPIANLSTTSHHELIGDTLHWASHLAHNSEDLRLLISQSLYEQVGDSKQASWLPGNEVSDLHGCRQATWWLDALEQKQQTLIQRQIRHITTI